jgi:hypothetical protein
MKLMKDIIPEPSVAFGAVGSEGGRSPSNISNEFHQNIGVHSIECLALPYNRNQLFELFFFHQI